MLPENLRESLFTAEPLSPERQQRFHDELVRIMEPRLSRRYRVYYTMMLVCLLMGVFGESCRLVFYADHRLVSALYVLIWAASAAWVFHILQRGAEPLRAMQGMSKAAAGIATAVAFILIFYGLKNPSLTAVFWALLGLLAFLMMSFINLWNRVITAERTTREQILRIEYHLADLASRQAPPPSR